MLRKLFISNYAIIDQLELQFSEKLTVITGETGAGKSIAMEALSLVLGARADSSVLFDKSVKCIVEAEFDIRSLPLQNFFEEYSLDYDVQLILRREISIAGKSRAFINDTPFSLQVIKFLGEILVDMHQQHESYEISTSRFQLALLDSIAHQENKVAAYKKSYSQFQSAMSEWNRLNDKHRYEVKEMDYLNFQLDELRKADLKADEQESLEEEQTKLIHADEIQKALSQALLQLQESEGAVLTQLRKIGSLISGMKKYFAFPDEISSRIESSRIELTDISSQLERLQESVIPDPQKLQQTQQRLDLIYRLQKKHSAENIQSLLDIQNDIERRINSMDSLADELDKRALENTANRKMLIDQAKHISSGRQNQISKVEQTINQMLNDVGMPHAQISILHVPTPDDEINESGVDSFQFLFASNKGSEFQEIKKIASGGELSRLMLCFKSLVAESTALPTLIFDEIDSGISGEAAVKVSRILKKLSASHQVICITHLPQLAAKGDVHYFVYKEILSERTFTRVRSLDMDEKIRTIAKMISGDHPTAAALASAKELLN